jgi:hypothetical protein
VERIRASTGAWPDVTLLAGKDPLPRRIHAEGRARGNRCGKTATNYTGIPADPAALARARDSRAEPGALPDPAPQRRRTTACRTG